MASMHPNNEELSEFQTLPPLCPFSQYVNNSILSVTVIAVFEFEIPFNKSQTINLLQHIFFPKVNSLFSSIIVTDKKGIQRWKKVELKFEEHVIVPEFPSGLSLEDYETHFNGYLSKIDMEKLSENRPPWEVHVFMYPRKNAAGTLVFKLSHALGDGYSLLSALFSCVKREDDSNLNASFPSCSSRFNRGPMKCSKLGSCISLCLNTVYDSAWNLMKGTFMKDDNTVIRSKEPRVDFEAIYISSITLKLDHIKQIKSKVGGTLNDVLLGLISYTIHLYMQKKGQSSRGASITALVAFNMRMLKGFKSIEDMLNANIWGNHVSFLFLPLCPQISDDDPLNFIKKARKGMKKKSNSRAFYFFGILLSLVDSIRGPKAAAGFVYSTIKNTSLGISSLVGPMQKVVLADHPINSFYFTMSGVPQSLSFTVVSYMGELRLIARVEKGFIDSEVLVSSMNEAFQKIFQAACGKDATKPI